MPQMNPLSARKGNYLSRLVTDPERRRSSRRPCHFFARACHLAHGARGIRETLVAVQDISEHGVRLTSEHPNEIPQHFYLTLGHYQNQIACAVVSRDNETLRCEFIREVRPEFVDFLAAIENPDLTLHEIRHPMFIQQPGH